MTSIELLPTGTFMPFSKPEIEQSIPARFEQQVVRHPNRTAVQAPPHTLSYQQLDRLANRVAHGILARRGEGAEPIGLLMGQGAPLIAAILGVLKAGKFYLPIDSSDPDARVAFMASDAVAALLITERTDSATGRSGERPSRCTFDELVSSQPEGSPSLAVTPDTPAYLYYTSGSTGRPKGVWDAHRNVLHNIMRYTNSLRISAWDRLTLIQPPGFSGAVSSMFGALLNGASVCPYDARQEGIGPALAAWLIRERITMYHSVPMIFRAFLTGDVRFPDIRVIRLEGDGATRLDVELYRKHFGPACVLVHGLGATETGISRQWFIDRETQVPDGIVPIGHGTEDMHGTVVDDAGQDVGMDRVGEIVIRSKYLATGYWNLPELTEAAFRPGRAGSGERIYRTGDLGRVRQGGCLEYLGRKDAGFKIRGHRVEPAEVEAALQGLQLFKAAVVVTRADSAGNPRLLAYLVSAITPAPSVALIRSRLAEALPDYMIPTRFVFLNALPLNSNGKVDRKALPSADEVPTERPTKYVAPRDRVESELVEIWERLLRTSPIGVADNFFDAGGDSLTATELFTAMKAITPQDFLPATIAEAPTIAQLAQRIRGDPPARSGVLVPLQTSGDGPKFFCVPAHAGDSLALVALARCLGREHPMFGLQSVGLTGDEHPLTSITAMADRNIEAIRTVQPRGPYHLGGRCWGAVVALEMAHRLIAGGDEVGLLCFMNVSPSDFPGLVSTSSRRRFRRRGRDTEMGALWRGTVAPAWWKRPLYLAREVARGARRELMHLGKKGLVRTLFGLDLPLPQWLRDADFLNLEAFARHTSRAYPGRVLLILSAEDLALCGSDPAPVWRELAGEGVEIRSVPGRDDAMFREPEVQLLAELLRTSLRAARA